MTVESYRQNNFTADLATKEAADTYWLGYKVRLVTSGGGYLLISTVQAQNNLATNPLVSSSLATTSWRLAKGQCEKTQIHVYLKIVSVEEKRHPGEQLRFTTIFTSHSLS